MSDFFFKGDEEQNQKEDFVKNFYEKKDIQFANSYEINWKE